MKLIGLGMYENKMSFLLMWSAVNWDHAQGVSFCELFTNMKHNFPCHRAHAFCLFLFNTSHTTSLLTVIHVSCLFLPQHPTSQTPSLCLTHLKSSHRALPDTSHLCTAFEEENSNHSIALVLLYFQFLLSIFSREWQVKQRSTCLSLVGSNSGT